MAIAHKQEKPLARTYAEVASSKPSSSDQGDEPEAKRVAREQTPASIPKNPAGTFRNDIILAAKNDNIKKFQTCLVQQFANNPTFVFSTFTLDDLANEIRHFNIAFAGILNKINQEVHSHFDVERIKALCNTLGETSLKNRYINNVDKSKNWLSAEYCIFIDRKVAVKYNVGINIRETDLEALIEEFVPSSKRTDFMNTQLGNFIRDFTPRESASESERKAEGAHFETKKDMLQLNEKIIKRFFPPQFDKMNISAKDEKHEINIELKKGDYIFNLHVTFDTNQIVIAPEDFLPTIFVYLDEINKFKELPFKGKNWVRHGASPEEKPVAFNPPQVHVSSSSSGGTFKHPLRLFSPPSSLQSSDNSEEDSLPVMPSPQRRTN